VPSQPVQPPAPAATTGTPAPTGKIADLQEKPNGAIVTLDTGFRAASKDVEHTKALRAYRSVNATIKLETRPSSDPSKFAPVIVRIELVNTGVVEREPGEEG
jgi:hypothetical protein